MAYRKVVKGDRISEYVLVSKLGQGGFGEVWKAEHYQIQGKFVAIKIPTRPESMNCLKQEAVFQHELDHPNIVKTIGLDTQSDPPYFIMEYVEGKNLRQMMIEDGILPPPYAIDIAVQVCEAMAFAHSKGVVHKDVKPENILVEKKKVDVSNKGKALLHYVKLTDLGLGAFPDTRQSEILISENARTSGVRIMSGTLFYMAPEQMFPGRQVDARADLYSLGVVLYEMLTGELPLGMDLPSELNPVVTPELDAITKKALSVDRDMRYQSARELAADLHRAKEAFLLKLVASGAPVLEVGKVESRRHTPTAAALGPAADVPVPAEPPPAATSRKRWLHFAEWGLLAFVVALLAVSGVTFVKLHRAARDAGLGKDDPAARPAERLGGPVRIATKPEGAEAWFDGKRAGVTPLEVPQVTFERHTLTLSREFHESREFALEPKTVDGKKCFGIVDRGARKEVAVRECGQGFALEGIELARLTGKIRITTPGVDQAQVYIDGQFYGVTPFVYEALQAGMHQFTISQEGFKDVKFFERIEGGAEIVKEFALLSKGTPDAEPKHKMIRVRVTSSPSEAVLYVENDEKGPTPRDLDLAPGRYEVRLLMPYHETWTGILTVDAATQSASYELVKIKTRVTFESEPQGAVVFLDDQRIGVTPVSVEAIEGGSHKATFALDGHYPQTTTFEVVNKEPVGLKPTLQKIRPGGLLVECEVRGAEVFLDGKSVGRTPLPARPLEAGRHRVRVLGAERVVVVEPEVEKKLALTLKDLEMVRVTDGDFFYGAASPKPTEVKQVNDRTPAYYIDRFEVTNEQYALFLAHLAETGDHRGCHQDEDRRDPRNHKPAYWEDERFNGARQPVVGVTWYDAWAYAAWAGKRLPTEREWEKAARGKTGWTYPWGNEWGAGEKRCNWGDTEGGTDGFKLTAPVGACSGVSPFGCFDMVGNVSEWCVDEYEGRPPNKVIRGGSYLEQKWNTTTARWYERPATNASTIGFRCVVDEKK